MTKHKWMLGAAVAGLAVSAVTPLATAGAAPARPVSGSDASGVRQVGPARDALSSPLQDKMVALRQRALQRRIAGDPAAQGPVVKVGNEVATPGAGTASRRTATRRVAAQKSNGRPQYVKLANQGTDKLFVIVAEFGNKTDPRYGTYKGFTGTDFDGAHKAGDPVPGYTLPGPLKNQIKPPDRSVDNTTIYRPDNSQSVLQKLYFGKGKGVNSLSNYYSMQSSGRFTFDGQVTDWVKVPYNEASYGSDYCGSNVCSNTWNLVADAVNRWAADRTAAGWSNAKITSYLQQYDTQDVYDYDNDGNFNEPDGYLDRFQILHAGQDEATGGGQNANSGDYQENAIWSHSWYVNGNQFGSSGPAYNKAGGTQIGNTGFWVGAYTVQPENAGVGVLAHETAHNLGLPDEYDTSYTGESSSAFWTCMASGSYMNDGPQEGLGTKCDDLSGYGKLQLGWLNYGVALPGDKASAFNLGPAEYNSQKRQGVVTQLPPKMVTTTYPRPFAGSNEWWSSSGNNLETTMTRAVDLTGANTATLTAKVNYDIEQGYDYAYVEVSPDGGTTWTAVPFTLDGQPGGTDGTRPAISGSSNGAWQTLAADLSAYKGKNVQMRFRYLTDAGVSLDGLFLDDISVATDKGVIFTDGAEEGTGGWSLDGFRTTTGTETVSYPNYYIAENKTYQSYDSTLKTGPYYFGEPKRPDWADRFPYQKGLLVSYWDSSQVDNNVGQHPGAGLILPIDARPTLFRRPDGRPFRTRVQVFDATFGTKWTTGFTIDDLGTPFRMRTQRPVTTFDDRKSWLDRKGARTCNITAGQVVSTQPAQCAGSANPPKTGTVIKVLRQDTIGSMRIRVTPAPVSSAAESRLKASAPHVEGPGKGTTRR